MEPATPKKLSPLDATLLVMGGIIGVGIFFNPQQAAGGAFEPWAFMTLWACGGLIAMAAAATFAEFGGSFPRSGGWFVYLREAFGPFPAFLFAWIVLFAVSTGAVAAMATFCAGMLTVVAPTVIGADGLLGARATAALLVIAVTLIALSGVKRAALLQNACMFTKLAVLGVLIVAGFLLDTPQEVVAEEARALTAEPERSLLRGMFSALKPVFFSYGGWQMVGYIASQVENPSRVLPRAIVGGVLGVIVVYLLANASFLRALGIDGMAADQDFATTIATASLGAGGGRLLALGMAISALGVVLVTVLATPWLYVAMSRDGLFFQRFGVLHPRTGAPNLALLVQLAIILFYIFAGTLQDFVNGVVFVEWIFHGLVACALIHLRRARPDLPRPFTSPAFPLAPVVYALTAAVIVLSSLWVDEPRTKYAGLVILIVGTLAYRPWRALMRRAMA